jgi:hypothetical protein
MFLTINGYGADVLLLVFVWDDVAIRDKEAADVTI